MPIFFRSYFFLFVLGFLLLMVSCASHEPVEPPQVFQDIPKFEFQSDETSKEKLDYWDLFTSDQDFQTFVNDIFDHNYSVKQSLAKIKQNQAKYRVTAASLMPYISSGLSATKSQSVSESTEEPVSSESERFSLSLSATYDLDFFGENSANLSAAILEILAQVEEHKYLLLTLFNDFTLALFNLQEAREQTVRLENTLLNDKSNLEFITNRYNLGLASLTDVYQAQQQVISTRSKLPDYQSIIYTQQFKIKQLSGLFKLGKNRIINENLELDLPEVAVGLPSDLVRFRPDINASLLRIKASNHQVAASVAAQYPRISLTVSGGTQSQELSNLLNPDYSIWSLVGNVTLPIFDAGGKKAEIERQKAILLERVELYKSKLFQAFQKTSEYLSRIQLQNEKIKLIEEQSKITKFILTETTNNYLQGIDDWNRVLTAQTAAYSAQSQLITAKRDLKILKVQLYTTLGSRWPDKIAEQQLSFLLNDITKKSKDHSNTKEASSHD